VLEIILNYSYILMDITDILLITVTLILIGTVGISVWRLMKYSDVYPIKQLSPRVTAMIAIVMLLTCGCGSLHT
jgi:hypothetical protein